MTEVRRQIVEFGDGSFVVESSVPGYWRAYRPDNTLLTEPDAHRPGRSIARLFPGADPARAALAALGFAADARVLTLEADGDVEPRT